MKPIVLVITTDGVGGAEKRMAEVWLHLAPQLPNLRMLVRRSTFDQLRKRPDLARLECFDQRITAIEATNPSYPATVWAFASHLWRLPRGSVVHHILHAPPLLHRLRGHRLLLSWVGTTFPRAGEKPHDWAVSMMSLSAADRVDVLNPEIWGLLAARPSLADKLRLTVGGTIVDAHTFRPLAKQDLVVFLGRMESYKNALAFVTAIPLIAERLSQAGKRAAFRLYGRPGDQAGAVAGLLRSEAYRGFDVRWEYTSDPASVLGPARVFLSLQSPSNYPSKALAEAMACGCLPVITDSGESRRMADPALAVFIPEHFTALQLADAVQGIMALDDRTFAAQSDAVRKEALRRFAIGPQADYFARLYHELGASC